MNIAILTVSNSRTKDNDESGDYLASKLSQDTHEILAKKIVKDNRYEIRAAMSQWILDPKVQVIISSGGTGITGSDGTPEAVIPLLDKQIEGFGELFRSLSLKEIGSSTILSRAVAGIANETIVFCLPGSPSAVRLAWEEIIKAQLDKSTKPCNMVQLAHRFGES